MRTSRLEICAWRPNVARGGSVPANIAEGYGRDSTGSYLHFLKIARGSLKELETHLLLAQRVGALPNAPANELLAKLERVGRMLNALIRAVQSSRDASSAAAAAD